MPTAHRGGAVQRFPWLARRRSLGLVLGGRGPVGSTWPFPAGVFGSRIDLLQTKLLEVTNFSVFVSAVTLSLFRRTNWKSGAAKMPTHSAENRLDGDSVTISA